MDRTAVFAVAVIAGALAGGGAAFALRAPAAVIDNTSVRPATEPVDAAARAGLREMDGRVAILEAALSRQEEELVRLRAAAARPGGAPGAAGPDGAEPSAPLEGTAAEAKDAEKPDMDRFAREMAKGMRQGMRAEFEKIAALVLDPTPERVAQRKQQIEFFAKMFGQQAGLDESEQKRLVEIVDEVDRRARDELRPLMTGNDDVSKLDWTRFKQVSNESFAEQDRQFDVSFPKEKSERLKQQMTPVRNIFGAMLDDMEKQAKAPPADPAK